MDYSALGAIRGGLDSEKGISASLATRNPGHSQKPLVVSKQQTGSKNYASAGHELDFFAEKLSPHTAKLAEGHTAVCAFVNDILNARTLDVLDRQNVRFVALRCAGFNQVDLRYASSLGMKIAHVPAYSPYAVAEFALALVLALNRRIHRAYNRVRDGNFSIDGLLGFDLDEKTVGVVGTGKIGRVFLRPLDGFWGTPSRLRFLPKP
jgi:D-lactate dehydrogenase